MIFYWLTADGIECIVTPPSLISTQSGNRVKTDKKDRLKSATLLESKKSLFCIMVGIALCVKQDLGARYGVCNLRA